MDLNNSDISSYNHTSYQMSLPISIKFWSYLLVDIPSTGCAFFLLYQFLTKRVLRCAMNNHAIIAITFSSLATNLIDVPLSLISIKLGRVWPQTPVICIIWWFASIVIYVITNVLLAWASFERHILIFHEKWLSTKNKRLLIHYLPLIVFISYPIIFYVVAAFILYCDEPFVFDYTQAICDWSPCYIGQTTAVMYDLWVNGILPNSIIAVCSIGLLIRVVWQRHIRLRQPIQWQKYRKLTIQMLSLSMVFLIFNLPFLIYAILQFANILPSDINPEIYDYLMFLTNFCILILPFITILSLPSEFWLRKWQNALTSIIRPNTVVPIQSIPAATMTMQRTQLN